MQKNIINSIKKFILILSVLLVSVSAFAVPNLIIPVDFTVAKNNGIGVSENKTVTPTLPTPTFSVPAGNYSTTQYITISQGNTNATIRYTMDGSTPDLTSPIYSSSIPVSIPTTINAISVLSGYTNSLVASAFYNVLVPVATPTFSIQGGTYNTTQYVTINSTTVGTSIYYTTDGTDPTVNSTIYTGSIIVDITKLLKPLQLKVQ